MSLLVPPWGRRAESDRTTPFRVHLTPLPFLTGLSDVTFLTEMPELVACGRFDPESTLSARACNSGLIAMLSPFLYGMDDLPDWDLDDRIAPSRSRSHTSC